MIERIATEVIAGAYALLQFILVTNIGRKFK